VGISDVGCLLEGVFGKLKVVRCSTHVIRSDPLGIALVATFSNKSHGKQDVLILMSLVYLTHYMYSKLLSKDNSILYSIKPQ
jgi:hypothetical protein